MFIPSQPKKPEGSLDLKGIKVPIKQLMIAVIRTISRKIWAYIEAQYLSQLLHRLLKDRAVYSHYGSCCGLVVSKNTLASHSIPATEMPRRRMTVIVPMIRISLISSVMMASTPCEYIRNCQNRIRFTIHLSVSIYFHLLLHKTLTV